MIPGAVFHVSSRSESGHSQGRLGESVGRVQNDQTQYELSTSRTTKVGRTEPLELRETIIASSWSRKKTRCTNSRHMNGDETLPRSYARLGWQIGSCTLPLVGCSGAQSALDPAGKAAERMADLFWWMTAGAAVVWLGVMVLMVYAVRARPDVDRRRQAHTLILAGAITPAIVLGALLVYGLSILPQVIAPAPDGSLRVSVYGEQWWWRVRYEPPGRQPFELANEIRMPVGEPVEFLLHSNNVIHSFWIPSLGGKMDMIPGRVNRLALHATKTGTFRGACAEYCGASHANMAFDAIVVSREEFDRWMLRQSEPAANLVAVPGVAQ